MRQAPLIAASIALFPTAVLAQGASYRLFNVTPLTLPYVFAYSSCFVPDSDYAQKLLKAHKSSPDQLPTLCREQRQTIEELAATKMQGERKRVRETELKQLSKSLDHIELQYPIAATSLANGNSNAEN